ncbi:AMP binding protein [Suillus bovinus]|uniref:AMP binding protein n=1 Tax=Suillus bovinus TaxID=48563 RepID=UPI001B871539|nr:AMP binding protein [Suillus bovinus]KAG2142242.1 AMP binding protein [Suillus bovinus]
MTDTIYTSSYPSVPICSRSIFTHILGVSSSSPRGTVGGFPASSPAFIDALSGTTISRGKLRSYALQLAFSLHRLPSPLENHTKTVLIFSPNSITWPVMMLGAVAAGFCATLANSGYTSNELKYQYIDAGAHLIFVHPSLVGTARTMLRSLGLSEQEIRSRVIVAEVQWITGIKDASIPDDQLKDLVTISQLLGRGELKEEVSFDGERSNETVYLCYSSGTTGQPKGVETTHYNLISVLEIIKPVWPNSKPCLTPSIPVQGGVDVFFGCLPYYHIYGGVKLLLLPLFLGVPGVVMAGFDPDGFCAAIARYRVTVGFVVPPMLVVFARHPGRSSSSFFLASPLKFQKHDLTSLTVLFSGAAPLGAELVSTVMKRMKSVGADVSIPQGYGLTETSPTVFLLPVSDASSHIGAAGVLLPNLEVRLVGEAEGEAHTDIPGAGEVWVRGPTIMKGYLNKPTATAEAITPDGWFKTGDIGVRDKDGFFTIVDRRKELIKYKARFPRFPPAELESVLLQHAEIADAAVIGIESKEEATELPRAYITPSRPLSPQEASSFALSVQNWVSQRVASHKRLRGGVVIIDTIPKSAAGKILRRELRERAKTDVAEGQLKPRAKL